MMTASFVSFASVCCILGFSLVSAEVTSSQTCGKSNPVPTGQSSASGSVKKGEYPWYASLYTKQNQRDSFTQVCGGTIISPRVILTAGHCVYGGADAVVKAGDLKVAVGKFDVKWDSEEKDAQKFDVERIVQHPSYNRRGFSNDLALIIVARDIKMSDTVLPACVDWTGSHSVQNGDIGTIVSWNRTSHDTKIEDIHLRAAKGSYLDVSNCTDKVPDQMKPILNSERFCIHYTNDTGLGVGDSGAGLTVEKNGVHYVIGVGGFGVVKLSPIYAFTNIATFKDWIQSVVMGSTSISS